jgi:RNA polymerase sigma-70 factor (ECF subfamily)
MIFTMQPDREVDAMTSLDLSAIEKRLLAARSRLLRQVRQSGVAADAADDVVQEILMTAWQHVHQLYTPDLLDGWLNGICRNMCLRWKRSNHIRERYHPAFCHVLDEETSMNSTLSEETIPDLTVLDPIEELHRQELATLLDRALGHLPETARTVLELCYLAEMPQSEAASRLGLTTNALEVRLHRARQRLREVLSRELRTDAEEFGLEVDTEEETLWHQTRIWCFCCGRQFLKGIFEPYHGAEPFNLHPQIRFRLRCPRCTPPPQAVLSLVEPATGKTRSFRAALKRTEHYGHQYYTQILATGKHACSRCGAWVQTWVTGSDTLPDHRPWPGEFYYYHGIMILVACPACGLIANPSVSSYFFPHPEVQCFRQNHPRWIVETEISTHYAEQQAIRVRFADAVSTARLTLFVHPQTFQVFATFQE